MTRETLEREFSRLISLLVQSALAYARAIEDAEPEQIMRQTRNMKEYAEALLSIEKDVLALEAKENDPWVQSR